MGFIAASVTDLLPHPEHFVLLLFPLAYLVPCGCFGEGAAAGLRVLSAVTLQQLLTIAGGLLDTELYIEPFGVDFMD